MQKLNVSVVICTRNRNEYLAKCVGSLLKQTYPPKEIIIVDDYSDKSILKFLKKEFSRIPLSLQKLFHFKTDLIVLRNKEHSGIVKSRNLGIKVASGEIVAFLDDDGFAHKSWVENLIKSYSNQKILGVGGPVVEIGRNIKTPVKPIKRLAFIKKGRIVTNYRIKKLEEIKYFPRKFVPFLQGGNMSFRREAVLQANGADVNLIGNCYREETDICLKISKRGKLLFEPQAVTYHNTAKKGGNTDIIKFNIDNFLYYMFRNTTYFFFKHFDIGKAFDLTLHSLNNQVKLIQKNKTGINRDYLQIQDRIKSTLAVIKGCIAGLYCWFKTREDQLRLIFSHPSNVKTYKIIILGSTIKLIELENNTKFLKKLLGL